MVILIVNHDKLLGHDKLVHWSCLYADWYCAHWSIVPAFGNGFGVPALMQKRSSGEVLDNLFGKTSISWYPAMLAIFVQSWRFRESNASYSFGTIEINCLFLQVNHVDIWPCLTPQLKAHGAGAPGAGS